MKSAPSRKPTPSADERRPHDQRAADPDERDGEQDDPAAVGPHATALRDATTITRQGAFRRT